MTDDQIKQMVNRFLSWKLPRDTFNPDCGISFNKAPINTHTPWPSQYEPSGTNLFDAMQANAMVRHMIEGMPAPADAEPVAWRYETLQCEGGWKQRYSDVRINEAPYNRNIQPLYARPQPDPNYARPASPVMAEVEKALCEIVDTPCSVINDSESIRFSFNVLQKIARAALAKLRVESDPNNQKAST